MRPSARKGNRSDLPKQLTQPTVATGQPYGHAGAQQDSMKVIPLARQVSTPPPVGPGTPTPASGGVDFNQVLAAAKTVVPPSSTLNAPTQRPGEPITAGLAGALVPPTPDNGSQFMLQLARAPGAPAALAELGNYLASGRA